MRSMGFGCQTCTICLGLAVMAGCGGSVVSTYGPDAGIVANRTTFSHTFNYTGGEQSFKVPRGVRSITVVARGAAGGGEICYSYCYGHTYFGRGGRVYAIIPVRPGEKLYVFVGGAGTTVGGFNGGGNPGGYGQRYGGGGASDVRQGSDALSHRIVIAAGGGGQGAGCRCDVGGSGGGATGGTGVGDASSGYGGGGGTGGTQDQGGSGGIGGVGTSGENGSPGGPGRLGSGGSGGLGGVNPSGYNGDSGGGGGGGYYGGGGGGGGGAAFASIYGGPGGGGGGGSSFAEAKARNVRMWAGWHKATTNGLVVFSWQ